MTVRPVELVVVIPTRNRATLACSAIRSVLAQKATAIVVSDNSTMNEEVDTLRQFCQGLDTRRVRYIRPPTPLPMSEHWEWALHQALASFDSSHVVYLTDRMVFKIHALSTLLRLATRYPDCVVAYNHDRINDLSRPIRLEQVSCSGALYELPSKLLLASSAELRWNFFPCLPRMLNCVVPRTTFATITRHYGSVFLSTAPDCCFAYRYLERFDSVLYYDQAPLINYALDRSNGASQGRGVATKDHLDFMANLDGRLMNNAAPIPDITTVWNTIVHEYCLVKAKTHSPKFPDIDKQRYVDLLSRDLEDIENPQLRERFQAMLTKYRNDFRCVVRPLGWLGPKDTITEFDTVADALAYGGKQMRYANWVESTIELNAPSRVLWRGEGWPAGFARHLYLRFLRQRQRLREVSQRQLKVSQRWFNRHVLWRFRTK